MRTVAWSDEAERQLDAWIDYLRAEAGPEIAKRARDETRSKAASLARFSGHRRSMLWNGYQEVSLTDWHKLMVYRVVADQVENFRAVRHAPGPRPRAAVTVALVACTLAACGQAAGIKHATPDWTRRHAHSGEWILDTLDRKEAYGLARVFIDQRGFWIEGCGTSVGSLSSFDAITSARLNEAQHVCTSNELEVQRRLFDMFTQSAAVTFTRPSGMSLDTRMTVRETDGRTAIFVPQSVYPL